MSAIITPSTVVSTSPVAPSVKLGSLVPYTLVWAPAVMVRVAGVTVRLLPVKWIV